jgi:His-Xaa-Ser system radical SAM maturase HxsB
MVHPDFRPREAFTQGTTYRLLPFRFTRLASGGVLLVNETGDWITIPPPEFLRFVEGELSRTSGTYFDLKAKYFLFDSDSLVPFEMLATQYRTQKSFLAGFTQLHLFVVTLRCEHSCKYCQVSRVSTDRVRYDMTSDTAMRALDLAFRSPAPTLKIEFQGGEPLLNFPMIREVIEGAEARKRETGKAVEYVVTTNLALINDEMLAYFTTRGVYISTSLDGPSFLHNANRPRPGGDSYERTIDGIRRAREAVGRERVAALMTTTKRSLEYPEAIVDEYVEQGFRSIFLRALSPYGYTTDEFLVFYRRALDRILDVNRAGVTFVESYTQLLLTRMLTPFPTAYVDLRSPSGAGIGAAVYNYDGDVYASDEGRMLTEMGDRRFRLGNVWTETYEDIFGGARLREIATAGVAESLPGCSDCAFLSWCGADPVFHYATQGSLRGHRPTSDFHRKHDFLFRHLLALYENDATARGIFRAWVANMPVSDVLGRVA